MATPGKLPDGVRTFIVQRLAMFDTPKEIADAVKEVHGIEISRQAVEEYDPAKRPNLARKWAELHRATREVFVAEIAREPAASRPVRVRRLAKMALTAQSSGDCRLAMELFKQIAKEVGGVYTNRREVTGGGGAPLVTAQNPLVQMSTEQLAARALHLAGEIE